jgi:hypothetical protein
VPHQPAPPSGFNLPDEPLHQGDMPEGAGLTLGRLVMCRGRTDRPFVGVLVKCLECKRMHRFNWRWNWGLAAGVVSFQESRCARGHRHPCWVGLDPAAAAENAAVHQAAHEAYEAWDADRAARRAAKAAESAPVADDPSDSGPSLDTPDRPR